MLAVDGEPVGGTGSGAIWCARPGYCGPVCGGDGEERGGGVSRELVDRAREYAKQLRGSRITGPLLMELSDALERLEESNRTPRRMTGRQSDTDHGG